MIALCTVLCGGESCMDMADCYRGKGGVPSGIPDFAQLFAVAGHVRPGVSFAGAGKAPLLFSKVYYVVHRKLPKRGELCCSTTDFGYRRVVRDFGVATVRLASLAGDGATCFNPQCGRHSFRSAWNRNQRQRPRWRWRWRWRWRSYLHPIAPNLKSGGIFQI